MLLFIFQSYLCAGKEVNYQLFDNINVGLEANAITCFLQDEQGLLWIGSNKGLFSYDGYSSQPHFKFDDRSNTRIYCGVIVDKTYLYLGTDNGILVYNCRTDHYEELLIDFPKFVLSLTLQERKLWIGTLDGLFTYNLDSKQLHSYKSHVNSTLPHPSIYSILRTHDNQIYIGTYNGLCKYLPASDSFQQINLPTHSHKNNQFINTLFEDRGRNCIWIGTEGYLYKMNPRDKTNERIDCFQNNSIKSLLTDGNKNLLVGTDNGLYVYNENTLPQHIFHDSRNAHSLSNNIVWGIFADREQNIWLGTDYGISLYRFNRTLEYISISQMTGTGEGNHFYSVFKDSQGFYWFGGTNGIIRVDNFANEAPHSLWYKMGDKTYPLSHNRIRHIYEDREQQLWIATDGSIHRYDYDRKQFLQYNIVDSTGRYNSNWAYYIFEDNRRKLWVATCLGGIFVVDKQQLLKAGKENVVAEYNYSVRNGLSGAFINQILPDHEGNVWVLLYNNGIDKIDTRTRKVTSLPILPITGNKNPNFILCDQKGFIWAGFRGGVLRINPSKTTIEPIKFDSFQNNEVLSMQETDESIWLSTSDGFWEVNKTSLKARRMNLTSKRFTSMYYDRNSKEILLGELDGIAVTTPAKLSAGHAEHAIIATALYVNNQVLEQEEKSIRYTKAIELDYQQNNLSIELSDLPYSLEEKNMYVYELEGVDRDWNFLSSGQNKLSYNNLQPGNYRLVVSKLDQEGKPAEAAYTLDICVNPPWYYTFWAKAVYVLLFISLVAWVINFFRVKNRLKMEHHEKEKILEQSKQKMEFFSNLSHDLKTPLSLIITPLSKLMPEMKNQQERKLLEGVQRNAIKMNSLIHQVLDFNRIDNDSNTLLILSRVEFVGFARNILSLFEESTKDKSLKYCFQSDMEIIYVDVDVIKWESILTNLLSNATKYTPENGSITLSLSQKEDMLEISVSDSGMGIPQADIPYIFQRFFQSSRTLGKKEGTGIGLYLVQTYVELHGGKVSIASAENEGTTISIHLPASRELQPMTTDLEKIEEAKSISSPLVLLVEDNPEMMEMMKEILGNRYQLRTASNGKEGLELCLTIQPDMIITDLMMPVMDGIEMCRRIKEQLPLATIPIILLTAKSDKATELESIRRNIDVFIAKPFEADILLSRIEQLLASKETLEAKTRMEVISTPKAIEAVSVDEKFLMEITRVIEDRVDDSELNVNAICELMGINNKQMYRKTKQLTGMTPVEYIKSIRMKKAAMLLTKRTFTVSEVMYMVGFSNTSYFSKCFQSEFGVTPKQYLNGE